jgi:hypothetical protein
VEGGNGKEGREEERTNGRKDRVERFWKYA